MATRTNSGAVNNNVVNNTINKGVDAMKNAKKADLLAIINKQAAEITAQAERLAKAAEVFRTMQASGGMTVGEVKRVTFTKPAGKVKGKVLVQLIAGKDTEWVTYLTMEGKRGLYNMPIEGARYISGPIVGKMDQVVGSVYRPVTRK
jgi:hypothetical protein